MFDKFGGVTRRNFVKGGVAAGALAGLAACSSSNGSSTSTTASNSSSTYTGGSVSYYINDPVAIDPYNCQESEGTQVVKCLFDPLTKYDWANQELLPAAAESWEANDDASEFTFHLVKGAKFHNGDAVTSECFKRGWERMCDSTMTTPSEVSYHLDPVVGAKDMVAGKATEISGVTCPDDNTLVVKLTAPMADWPIVCSHQALDPVPQAALDDPASFLTAPIGNGPFKMDGEWVSGQYINVVKFDDYYGTSANIDAVNFSIQKDPDTAFLEFTAGNIDFTSIPSGRFAEVKQQYGESSDGYTVTKGAQVVDGAEASTYYLAVNCQDATMSNINVRRAISLAINRQNICDTLFEGVRKPATNIFPPIIDDDSSNDWQDCYYDKDAAQKLVDDNNLAGTKITLSCNSGGGHEDIMACIQGDLQAVGFEVEIEATEWAAYLQKLGDGSFQIGRLGWIADYPTMDNFLYPTFFSTADNNYSKWNSPDFDAKVEAARKIVDDDERRAAYREANQIVGDDMPVIPIMWYAHNHVGSDKFKSVYYDAAGIAHLATCQLNTK